MSKLYTTFETSNSLIFTFTQKYLNIMTTAQKNEELQALLTNGMTVIELINSNLGKAFDLLISTKKLDIIFHQIAWQERIKEKESMTTEKYMEQDKRVLTQMYVFGDFNVHN